MKKLVVAVVLVLAALAAWFALRGDDQQPATPAAKAPPERAPAPKPRTRAAETTATPAEAKPAATAKSPEKVADAEKGGELLVVDAAGTPLAGVTVGFLPIKEPPDPAVEAEFTKPGADPIDVVLRIGRTFSSDAEGRVALPKFDGMAAVAARHGAARGITGVGRQAPDWRLELRPAAKIQALVVDADGSPCGRVPALLLIAMGAEMYPVTSAPTQADGVAAFDDVDRYASDDGRAAVSVALPFAAPPSVAVDLKSPPSAPVKVVLPPSGRVRCVVAEENGAAAPDGTDVVLRRVNDDPNRARKLLIDRSDPEDAHAATTGGEAAFPYVGLSLDLEAEIGAMEGGRTSVRQRFAGPKTAGEESVVRLTLGGRRPQIVGRIVDEKGAPVAGLLVAATLAAPGRPRAGVNEKGADCTTDDAGRFQFAFDRTPDATPGLKLEIGRGERHRAFGVFARDGFAVVDLPGGLAAGRTDVGDVVFRGGGLLLAGVVVDEEGRPLAGAALTAMESGRKAWRTRVDGADEATSDAQGRFRLLGDPSKAKQVGVGASLAGRYVAESPMFDVGATDARIVMRSAGAVAGAVKLPPGKRGHDVTVVVTGPAAENGDAGHHGKRREVDDRVADDGTFEVGALRPGKARVAFRLGWNQEDTVFTVDDVEVVAGKVTRDPRLASVDLSKALGGLSVLATDRDRRPVAGAKVRVRAGDGGFWKDAGETNAEGVAVAQAKADEVAKGVDVAVTCRGRRSVVLHRTKSDAIVVLVPSRPTTVRVRLAAGASLPEPPFHLGASLHFLAPGAEDDEDEYHGPLDLSGNDKKFDKERVLEFETSDPGRYRVDLMMWQVEANSSGGGGVPTSPKTVVVAVGEDGAPADVVVAPDPEEVRDFIERMSK